MTTTTIIESCDIVTVITEGEQGPQGAAGTTLLNLLTDVDSTNKTDGSVLVYSTAVQKWVATTQLENQIIESGQY
jgi:ABC-type branched-subunit amino acid transport system ATPase component